MKSVKILLACLVAILVFSTLAYAEVPKMINYQGKLTTPTGALFNDTLAMIFSIYADSTGGTALWTETQTSVKIEYGVFSVLLGSVNPIPATVFDGNTRYLGLKVGSDNEMTPRKAIVSVGYAYKSFESDTSEYARKFSGIVENADKVDGYHYNANWPTSIGNIQTACSNDFHNIGGIADDVPDNDGEVPDNISINNGRLYAPSGTGNVGIGSTSPAFKLDVSGNVNATSGFLVDGSAVIDDVARYFYTRNTSINKFGAMPNGFGVDALNSGDWDFLVYEDGIYLQYSNPSAIVYVGGNIQDYNDGTVNIGEALDVDGAFSANTVNTGQGNYELYAMDQNVRTTDNPTFNRINLYDYGTAAGGFHVGGTSDPGTDNLIVDGNVGVGTTSPDAKLSVSTGNDEAASFRNNSSGAVSVWAYNTSGGAISCGTGDASSWAFQAIAYNNIADSIAIQCNGSINVTGNIKKNGVNYNHPDYVFEPDYKLMSLKELKQYVFKHKSLPNVISAEDVKKNNGFKMDELLIQMLEKIEEQTLYIFQLEQRITELENHKQ